MSTANGNERPTEGVMVTTDTPLEGGYEQAKAEPSLTPKQKAAQEWFLAVDEALELFYILAQQPVETEAFKAARARAAKLFGPEAAQ